MMPPSQAAPAARQAVAERLRQRASLEPRDEHVRLHQHAAGQHERREHQREQHEHRPRAADEQDEPESEARLAIRISTAAGATSQARCSR